MSRKLLAAALAAALMVGGGAVSAEEPPAAEEVCRVVEAERTYRAARATYQNAHDRYLATRFGHHKEARRTAVADLESSREAFDEALREFGFISHNALREAYEGCLSVQKMSLPIQGGTIEKGGL